MRYSRFGRHVYATGSAEEAAYLAGIPTARTKILCFVISSTLAGFAGLIGMARISTGDPRVGRPVRAAGHRRSGARWRLAGRRSWLAIGTFVGVVLLGVVQAALTFNNVRPTGTTRSSAPSSSSRSSSPRSATFAGTGPRAGRCSRGWPAGRPDRSTTTPTDAPSAEPIQGETPA